MVVALLVALQLSGGPADEYGCTADQVESLRAAATLIGRGDDAAVAASVGQKTRDSVEPCALARLSRSALLGWAEARRVASLGGHPDVLAPVRSGLNELQQLKDDKPAVALEVEYAQTALRAAVAAAQDERAEMELLLIHARDVAERLAARGRRAVWPRSYNLLAGELWFEVDRFEDARAAYERAIRAEPSALALVGLARVEARMGRRQDACRTYKRAVEATASLRKAAAADLAHCR